MVNFVVKGPFEVPMKKLQGGARFIDCARLKEVVDASEGALNKAGCYVFSCRAARGSLPIYVGKATRSLLREAFNPRNLNNLQEYINDRRRGTLELSIVVQERIKLLANAKAISEIEEYLIVYAALRNKNLINIHGTATNWKIAGVANHRRPGAAAQTVREFKLMMGIATKKKATRDVDRDFEEIEPATTEIDSTAELIADEIGDGDTDEVTASRPPVN